MSVIDRYGISASFQQALGDLKDSAEKQKFQGVLNKDGRSSYPIANNSTTGNTS